MSLPPYSLLHTWPCALVHEKKHLTWVWGRWSISRQHCLAQGSRVLVHHCREVPVAGLLMEAAVTASAVRKQRETTTGVWLTSPFYSTQDHKQRDSAAQIHYGAQDSLTDRDPVVLTISINRGAMLEDLTQNLKRSRIVSP